MPFSTLRRLPDTIPPLAGVLIKHKPISQAARAECLMHEAKRRAQALVRQAESDALTCREHAATIGYEDGFGKAFEQVVDGLERIRRLQLTLHARVAHEIRQSLQSVLEDPELLLRLAEAFAVSHICMADQAPRVSIPNRAKRILPAVRERLRQAFPSVQVTGSDSPAFIVEWGEEVMEFNPIDTALDLSDAAAASCRNAIDAIDKDSLAQQVVADALQRLNRSSVAGTPDTPSPIELKTSEEYFDESPYHPDHD